MKKILIIVIISLLFVSIGWSQQYSINPSLDSLRTNAFAMLDIPSGGTGKISTAKANFVINKSIGNICDKYPALEKIDTVSASRATDGFALNSDFLRVKQIFRKDVYNDAGTQTIWIPISPVNYDSLAMVFKDKESNADQLKKTFGENTNWYTWGRRLYIHPKNYSETNAPDTFIVFYYARDVKLTSGTDSTDINPEYMDELFELILSELLALQEDYEGSQFYLNRFNPLVVPREADLKR